MSLTDEILKEGDNKPAAGATDEIPVDDSFSYEGYQVVRSEFFAHMLEPSITFNGNRMYVNSACLRKLPDVDYVQILIHREEKKLVLRPADENAKDAFLWCTSKNGVKHPKQITCRVFFAKLFTMMEWNPDFRYKLLGKVIRDRGDERLVVFDLKATEIYLRIVAEGQKPKISRKPVFPAEWENQFGLPVEEHRKQLTVNIFDGYTVFGITEEKMKDNGENTALEREGQDGQ